MPRQQKPWISLGQQLELLTDRGMTIDEPEIARSYLEKLGYYRLSGYWCYRQCKNDPLTAIEN